MSSAVKLAPCRSKFHMRSEINNQKASCFAVLECKPQFRDLAPVRSEFHSV